MGKRIEWVDSAKAIGILLVVYGHVMLGVHDAGIWGDTVNYNFQHSLVYTSHMPLFFLLSGIFATKWVQRKPSLAIWQKVKTLLIPYFIWGIIQAGIMQVFSGSTNNGQGLGNALQLPFMPYAQFWFLYDLFWIFVIYYLCVHVLMLSNTSLYVFAGIMFLVSPMLNLWEFWRIFYYLIFFVIGTKLLSLKDYLDQLDIWVSGLLFAILNICFFFVPMSTLIHNFASLFVALSGSVFIIQVAKFFNNNIVEYVGRNSMVIYLLHIIFTAGTRVILLKVGVNNLEIQIILGLLMGMIAPLVALEVAKKLKINKYIF